MALSVSVIVDRVEVVAVAGVMPLTMCVAMACVRTAETPHEVHKAGDLSPSQAEPLREAAATVMPALAPLPWPVEAPASLVPWILTVSCHSS